MAGAPNSTRPLRQPYHFLLAFGTRWSYNTGSTDLETFLSDPMLWLSRNRIGRGGAHRLLASLALLAYCATTFGLPLPADPRKGTSQPFPCQDHPCGCQSAEQCWRGCCCFSATERWAWAREHHVEPPAYAEPPEAEGWRTQPVREEEDATSAGSAQEHDGCQPPAPIESAASKGHSCCNPKPATSASAGSSRWGLTIAALHCNPLKALWIANGAVFPLPPRPEWHPGLAPGEWLLFTEFIAASLSSAPLDPPPRAALY